MPHLYQDGFTLPPDESMSTARTLVPRIISVLVLVAMAAALGYAAWIALRYFGRIGV